MGRRVKTDEEREVQRQARLAKQREYQRRKYAEGKVSKKKKSKPTKKDFTDAEFSKWWHDKIESVRQALNY